MRDEIRVQEVLMADLIVGDVVDVLRDVGIDSIKSPRVLTIAGSTKNLAVWDPTQFVVLGVEVGLERLSGGEEPQHRHITGREAGRLRKRRTGVAEKPRSRSQCAGGHQAR